LQTLAREPQALDAASEAVAIYTQFAAKRPGRYHPALASALLRQAGLLASMSRHGEALGAAEAAVQLYRDLAAADRGAVRPGPRQPGSARHLHRRGLRRGRRPVTREGWELFRLAATAARRKVMAVVGHGPQLQPEREPALCGRVLPLGATDSGAYI